MSLRTTFPLATLALFGLLAGCSAPPATRELPNLSAVKEQLLAYADSGGYERDLAAAAAQARTWVDQRTAANSDPATAARTKLAIVFDLDETLLSNFRHMRSMDLGYVPAMWEKWIDDADAPPIAPVADIYRLARARGVAVFYLTGRRERDRPATEKNLQLAGLGDYAALHCKPGDYQGTTQSFKTATRRRITEQGYTIIANIGDQQSDLDGGYAERTFKLPNPFYLTK